MSKTSKEPVLEFKFNTEDITNFLKDTDTRMKMLIDLPEQRQFLMRIEKIHIGQEWPAIYKEINEKILTVIPTIDLGRELSYKLAFYMHFCAHFFNSFGEPEADGAYVKWVGHFFNTYNDLVGPRDEQVLFLRAFPK